MTKRQEKTQITKEKIIKAAEILLKNNCFENMGLFTHILRKKKMLYMK